MALSVITLTQMQLVIISATLLGLACGVMGSFMVLRQRSLMGDALAHAALPGLCLSYLIFEQRSFLLLFLGSLSFGLLSVWCIQFITEHSRLKDDAAIGITLSSFFGLGIALSRIVQNRAGGNRAGLDDFIFGKAATMVREDLLVIAGVTVVVCIVTATLHKELKLLCFDRDHSCSLGLPVRRLDLLVVTCIALSTMAALPAVGVVMASALLIFPAVTARVLTCAYGRMICAAGAIGALSAGLGTALSAAPPAFSGLAITGLPTGPSIVVCNALLLGVAFAVSRGVARLKRFRGMGERHHEPRQ